MGTVTTPTRTRTGATARPAASVPLGGAAEDGPGRPLLLLALLVAVALLGAGLVVTTGLAVIGWLAGDDGGFGDALRVGAAGWLVATGSGVTVGGVSVGLIPLAGPLLVLLGGSRGGRWLAGAPGGDREAAVAPLLVGLVLALAAVGLALAAVPAGADVSPVRAGLAAGGLGVVGTGLGVARARGWWPVVAARLPDGWAADVAAVLRGAAAGLLSLLGTATLLVLLSVGLHLDDVTALGARLEPGPVGAVLLVVGCLALLPNAVLWAASYLLGPGFAIGSTTAVSPVGVTVGPLPAFPLLAALPAPGDAPAWALGLVLLPVLAGAVAGVVAEGADAAEAPPWWRTVAGGAAAGALAGLALAVLLLVSGGAVGPSALATTGPAPVAVLVAVGALGSGGALGAAGARLLRVVPLPRLWGPRPR